MRQTFVASAVLVQIGWIGSLAHAQDRGVPTTGQPAADVLASHDGWGNPTFIGGLTNAGPTSHSVW